MGRRKVETSQLIKTKKTLTKTFNQRKDGILKKAFELSTLCDVQVGVIIYGPNGDSPVVWPKESDRLTDILRKYQKTSIEERRKRAMDVSCFVKKADTSTAQRNDEVSMPEINPLLSDKKLDNFSVEQLLDLACSLDNKIEVVKAKIDALKNNQIINLPKFEEVLQSECGCGGVQQQNDVVLPELPCADEFPVNDHYIQLLERQVYEEDLLAKNRYDEDMMMMNGANYCNNLNNNKVNVGDFTGFMEGNFNGAMVHQFHLTSPRCDPFSLMPEQAQYDGVQLPLNYNNLVYF